MTADLRYPIGPFEGVESLTPVQRAAAVEAIATLPAALRAATRGMTKEQLETPYRPGGWTVRQVVHHVADSHINAYTRLRLALTEETPTVRPYQEADWAKLSDAAAGDIETSLTLLDALHGRWVALMRSLPVEAFQRRYRHPESGVHPVDNILAMYAWHGLHHTAHITEMRKRMGWN
jgi:uncharacterized damage-inducible protein DinB